MIFHTEDLVASVKLFNLLFTTNENYETQLIFMYVDSAAKQLCATLSEITKL